MTKRERQIFNSDVERHLRDIQNEQEAPNIMSGEDMHELAVERAEADFDSYQDMKMEDQREKDWE